MSWRASAFRLEKKARSAATVVQPQELKERLKKSAGAVQKKY